MDNNCWRYISLSYRSVCMVPYQHEVFKNRLHTFFTQTRMYTYKFNNTHTNIGSLQLGVIESAEERSGKSDGKWKRQKGARVLGWLDKWCTLLERWYFAHLFLQKFRGSRDQSLFFVTLISPLVSRGHNNLKLSDGSTLYKHRVHHKKKKEIFLFSIFNFFREKQREMVNDTREKI